MSLRLRLTLFYTLFLAVVLIGVAAAVYAFTQRSLITSLEADARQTVSTIIQDRRLAVTPQSLRSDTYYRVKVFLRSKTFTEWEDLREGNSFTVNQLTASQAHENPVNADLFELVSDDVYEELFASGRAVTVLRVPDSGVQMITYLRRHPLFIEPFEYSAISLVALPLPTETLAGLRNLLLRTIFFAFVAFAIGVWLLSSRVLFPVKRVTLTASQITGRDLSQRVPVPKTNDELKELAVTLNNMLDRLQESFETQRRFTADASHELRTPVTAIVGHVNYLLRRTKPTSEQIDSLTVIRREAERMAKLVNDLLELARADAGFSIQRDPMNIVEVVEAVHMDVAPVAGSANIEVSSSHPLIEVFGDASRLKQVVLNLVQNALNAGSQNIRLSVTKDKREVRLEILDDGPGIPNEAIPHLFDRFYRVDGARSTRGNGSGLGLAIVRWIVQQHDGQVSVESRLGEGTVFTVLLPVLNPKLTETPFMTQTRPPAGVPRETAS